MHNIEFVFAGVGIAVIVGGIFLILKSKRTKPSTSSKTTGRTLNDDKQKFGVIFNSIEDGVVLIDEKRIIQLFNPGATRMSGWEAVDAIGIDIATVIKLVDDKGELLTNMDYPFNKVFSVGQTIRQNNASILTRNNKQISVSISISPLNDDGKITSAVALIRNITEERQEENRLADFISTASHEMRTPVAAIEGYLALALNSKVATIDNRARDYLEKAHAATQHLGQLFQDLLTSAKAEDGRLTSHPQVVEVGSFLKKINEDLRFEAEKHQLGTEFIVGSSKTINANSNTSGEKAIAPLYFVYADPDRLREVVTNLFDNAVKYTPSGKITIGLTGDNNVVQFYIRDTGAGIEAEDLTHLFQKFYRVDNSSTRTIGGTGLGLFICRKIIELYNGRIWVESEIGKGSTFYINLPRLSSSQAKDLDSKTIGVEGTPQTPGTLS
ncbi:MAG TPA: ATP-binding protein [Candidatus Saccharimonadales bacterium]